MTQTLAIGTEKGGYLLTQNGDGWEVRGPMFAGWKVTAFHRSPGGTYLAAIGSNWFGSSIHRSSDLETWEQVTDGPQVPEGRTFEQVWAFAPAGERLYAGIAQAGLYSSDDDGITWAPVDALNKYPGHEDWSPGLGGLAAHHILTAGERLWVAISAVGVFRSDDAGGTFTRCDAGVTSTVEADTDSQSAGYCVHGLVADPNDPDRIWRQDHQGVYRTDDGGDHWEKIESGLPAGFGFAVRRHGSGRLFVCPLESDENRVPVDGRFSVYQSDDNGDSWGVSGTGWPVGSTFTVVLRRSMDIVDDMIAVGTTGGNVWISADVGDTWAPLEHSFPRILTVDFLD